MGPRMHPMFAARSLRALALVGALAACSDGHAPYAADEGPVTDVPTSSPRDQKETGNCWLFATAAWAESLERAAAKQDGRPEPPHFAPAYWDYWDWYAKITGGKVHGKTAAAVKDELDSGGSWGSAVELALARGLVRDPDFTGDGARSDGRATTAALATLAVSLTRGALATGLARADGALVRRELGRAFHLRPGVTDALTAVFGADGRETLTAGARALPGGIVVDPSDVVVLHPRPFGAATPGTLREAIGARAPGDNPDARTGAHAWTDVTFHGGGSKAETRAFLRRIQRALHAGAPVPVGWFWASNADPARTGAFEGVPAGPASDADSVDHETLLYDYDVADVPGFGHLAAGTPASPAALSAALADEARIVFFRAKDSYYDYRDGANARVGYSDLYVDYLVGSVRVCPAGAAASPARCRDAVPLEDVTLPPGF